jgi:type I restriction enzyme M protein
VGVVHRYISENITAYINIGEWEADNTEFDYAKLSDNEAEQARKNLVKTKGFFDSENRVSRAGFKRKD